MNLAIISSKHSKESSIALGKTLNCCVYDPYSSMYYHKPNEHYIWDNYIYNMGCSDYTSHETYNNSTQIAQCVHKAATWQKLSEENVTTVPVTYSKETALAWLDEDKIVVNRCTLVGKNSEGVSYSTKNAPNFFDSPLNTQAICWTRYVNHTYELRAYLVKGKPPLLFKKVNKNGIWEFKEIKKPEQKLLNELEKAHKAFNKMFCIAFDILHCKTGDYYFLEANSAPSLLIHKKILPMISSAIKEDIVRRNS